MPWVLPQGVSHVVTAVAGTISQLVFLLWKYVVPLYIYFVGTLPPWCRRKAGSVTVGQMSFFVWLCCLSGLGFGGELHCSICGLLSLVTGAVWGRRVVPGLWRVSMVFCFQGLGTAHQPLGRAAPVFKAAIVSPAPQPLGSSWERVPSTLPPEQCSMGAGSSSLHHMRGRIEGAGEEGYWPDREMVSRTIFFESQSCKYTHKRGLFCGLAA